MRHFTKCARGRQCEPTSSCWWWPPTTESLEQTHRGHQSAREAKVPVIVAINRSTSPRPLRSRAPGSAAAWGWWWKSWAATLLDVESLGQDQGRHRQAGRALSLQAENSRSQGQSRPSGQRHGQSKPSWIAARRGWRRSWSNVAPSRRRYLRGGCRLGPRACAGRRSRPAGGTGRPGHPVVCRIRPLAWRSGFAGTPRSWARWAGAPCASSTGGPAASTPGAASHADLPPRVFE